MNLFTNIKSGLRSLLGKQRVDRELDEELDSYLAASIADKQRSGLTPAAAHRAARAEIGIRLALGAQTRAVLWMVLRESLLLLAIGLALGLPLAFASTRLIREQLFGITALDPGTFAVAIAVVAAMTIVAAWLPARRATKVDPMIALRCD